MLKKAGIIVASATVGLLALSPLAFAGDKGEDHGKGGHGDHGYSEMDNRSPECNSAPQGVDNDIDQSATGVASPLLGIIGVAANAAAPVTAQTQAPVLSCNNVEDVIDVNVEDNFQDNDQDNDSLVSTIEDSGNITD